MRTDQATFTTIHSYFVWDHQRLDGQLADLKRRVDRGNLAGARKLLGHYRRGIQRHLQIEESVIFQTVASERTGAARVATSAVQDDHAKILIPVEEMARALEAEDVAAFRAAYARLAALMPLHNQKEEQALYPVDALVGAAEAERIVARLRSE